MWLARQSQRLILKHIQSVQAIVCALPSHQGEKTKHHIVEVVQGEGEDALRSIKVVEEEAPPNQDDTLYPSTVFGPTCDSMDVLSRGVLLPKMDIGDWMYFQNMGAYTSAAASTFNGFPTTDKFYVCSVPRQHFRRLIAEGRVRPETEAQAATTNDE